MNYGTFFGMEAQTVPVPIIAPEPGADFLRAIATPDGAFREGLRFLRGGGMLNETLHRLARDLDARGISYALVGAQALNRHGYRRFTEDINVLMTREGLDRFRAELVERGYRPAFVGATRAFRSTEKNVPIEMILTGEFPGDGKPKPVQFPDPNDVFVEMGGVRTITLGCLVELKLASGISAPHRLRDLADVLELIRVRGLNVEFAEQLDASVREKYLELHHAVATSGETEMSSENRENL